MRNVKELLISILLFHNIIYPRFTFSAGLDFFIPTVEKDSFVPGDSITLYKSNEYECQKEKWYRLWFFGGGVLGDISLPHTLKMFCSRNV